MSPSNPVATGRLYDSPPLLYRRQRSTLFQLHAGLTWYPVQMAYTYEHDDYWEGALIGQWVQYLSQGTYPIRHVHTRNIGKIHLSGAPWSSNRSWRIDFESVPLDTLGPYTHATDDIYETLHPLTRSEIAGWL